MQRFSVYLDEYECIEEYEDECGEYVHYDAAQSRITELETDLRFYKETVESQVVDRNRMTDRLTELEAEVARLTGVLGEISDTDPPPEWNNYSGITAIRRLAARALKREETK